MVKNVNSTRKRRAMTTEAAQRVKLAGHEAEKEFARLIGGQVYLGSGKKDVIDAQNNIHSVKSGEKKWQIFLYSRKRFEESIGFLGAKFFINCIDAFPEKRRNYLRDKNKFKLKLQEPMRNLRDFLSGASDSCFLHNNKIIFLQEAIFHSSEVDYFTIKEDLAFHVFDAGEVIKTIDESISLENSKTSQDDQMDDQKVILKLLDSGITIGEIEMRNDSKVHYRQIKFWMDKVKTLLLLKSKIAFKKRNSEEIFSYGKATKRFKLR